MKVNLLPEGPSQPSGARPPWGFGGPDRPQGRPGDARPPCVAVHAAGADVRGAVSCGDLSLSPDTGNWRFVEKVFFSHVCVLQFLRKPRVPP